MIKLTFALVRLPHLTREQFQDYWLNTHGPLVASVKDVLRIRRYVQLHSMDETVSAGIRASRNAPPQFDGVAQLWYDSLEDLAALAGDPAAAVGMRMLDRVFDNYVMTPMSAIVQEHIRNPEATDQARIAEAKAQLRKTYDWLEGWLEYYPVGDQITLVECAAAPSLFYADWVEEIGETCPRLQAWRAHLLKIPAVAQCVADARPFRPNFPPGAPDRD